LVEYANTALWLRLQNEIKGDAGDFNNEALAVLQEVYEQSF